ncbi:MAG: RNA-binding protein [Halobacteriaceae archaeon]
MSLPFHYIDLRTFAYETEDEQRVEKALRSLLPDEFGIEREETTGHNGDRIIVFSTRVENADDMRYVLNKLREQVDVDQIKHELSDRVDENCSMFLSFDKQQAYDGNILLGDGIAFRAKVEAYPAKQESAIENAKEAL